MLLGCAHPWNTPDPPKKNLGTEEAWRSGREHSWFLTQLVSKWSHPPGFLCFLSDLDSCHLTSLVLGELGLLKILASLQASFHLTRGQGHSAREVHLQAQPPPPPGPWGGGCCITVCLLFCCACCSSPGILDSPELFGSGAFQHSSTLSTTFPASLP